jgi:RNA polymerase sigma-70 factor (TIGR02960 family)
VTWLHPYPDFLLDELIDPAAGPEAQLVAKESISLAFVTALQLLPPRQRAVLILRDVLDFTAREVAGMFDATEESVTSALKRARATMSRAIATASTTPPAADSAAEQELLNQLVAAFETADVQGLVSLMTDDAWLRMPPVPLEYQEPEPIGEFFATVAFRDGRRYRLAPSRANGQPAFANNLRNPHHEFWHAFGLLVITIRGDRVSAITRFDNAVTGPFGFPRTLAASKPASNASFVTCSPHAGKSHSHRLRSSAQLGAGIRSPATSQRVRAAADSLLGDQLVPLGLGQPCHHQVVGMIDELEHFLVGY